VRSLFLLLLLLPAASFLQEIVGKWAKNDFPDQVIEFRKDGIVKSVKAVEPKTTKSQSSIRYTTINENEICYIIFEYNLEGHAPDKVKNKYIMNGDKLIIFDKIIDYENITTAKEIYKTIEVNYTSIIE
tara:strand:- start:68 stop:454 length:387 start_codon:yes stop_codon:yes gene_type:complete